MAATYHTQAEIDAARETLIDVSDRLMVWIEALDVNRERAVKLGHDRQAQRLEDAQYHYREVVERIVFPAINRINATATVVETEQACEPCQE